MTVTCSSMPSHANSVSLNSARVQANVEKSLKQAIEKHILAIPPSPSFCKREKKKKTPTNKPITTRTTVV